MNRNRLIVFVTALVLMGGLAIAQTNRVNSVGGAGGSSAASSLAASATGTDLTLTPGPLKVGGAGISTDGGVKVCQGSGTPCAQIVGSVSGGGATLGALTITGVRPIIFDTNVDSNFTYISAARLRSQNATSIYLDIGAFEANAASGANSISVGVNGSRMDFGAGASDYASSDGTSVTFAGPVKVAATQSNGTATIGGGGTVTATVVSGTKCTCTYNTVGVIVLLCNVATTTLTITGTVAAEVNYHCF